MESARIRVEHRALCPHLAAGLVFVIKDLPPDLCAVTVAEATRALTHVLTLCNSDIYYAKLCERIPAKAKFPPAQMAVELDKTFSDKELSAIMVNNGRQLQVRRLHL